MFYMLGVVFFVCQRYSSAVPPPVDYISWGCDLCYQDFWPECINPEEPHLRLVYFESFE